MGTFHEIGENVGGGTLWDKIPEEKFTSVDPKSPPL